MSRLSLPLALASLASIVATGCVNTDAVYDKVVEECRLAPEIPGCAVSTGGDVFEYAAKKRFAEIVEDAAEERCVMDVDCSDERNASGDSTYDLVQCFNQSTYIDVNASAFGGPDCKLACTIEFVECGSSEDDCYPLCGGECDVATVDACFRQRDACREWCNLSFGFGETRDPDDLARARELNDEIGL